MDVESFNQGVLAAITCPEGERAPVGSPIGFTAETDEEISARFASKQCRSGQRFACSAACMQERVGAQER
eukprot:scaffold10967_cov20-Tisochrysis_lutea.AAC.3